jgi:hypothetical protein
VASETPGGDRAAKRRERLQPKTSSTNRYYASGEPSVIENTAADSKTPPGGEPQPIVTRQARRDDKSTDRYYREQTVAPGAREGATGPPGKPRRTATPRPAAPTAGGLMINAGHEVNGVMQSVVGLLQGGVASVVVHVKKDDAGLLRRARTALDLLVTREVITEDQSRDVRFSYFDPKPAAGNADAFFGAPAPAGEKAADGPGADLDPEAFLAGDGDEPAVDTTPSNVQEVDTSADPAPAVTPAADAADDDESDFLTGRKTPAASAEPAAPPPEPVGIEIPFSTVPEGTIDLNEAGPRHLDEVPPVGADVGEEAAATEAMPGIGDAPKSRRAGRRSGRGS